MRPIASLAILALLGGCAGTRLPSAAQVYSNPNSFVGKRVRICGYGTISNLSERRDGTGHGVSLNGQVRQLDATLSAGGGMCVTGVLGYIGCADGTELCVDWMYNYAINVEHVVRY